MKSMLRNLAAIACLLALNIYSAAQSRITIKSSDTLDFILYLNEIQVNNLPCIAITFDYNESGKLNLKAHFPTHEQLDFSQIITTKKQSATYFDIEKSKGNYKFVLKSESVIAMKEVENDSSPAPSAVSEGPEPAVAPASSVIGDCSPIVSQEEYDRMLNEVKDNFFETRKLDVMRNFVTHHCVRVEQMRFMMTKLSLEDNKILLLKAGMDHIHDTANLKAVEDDFFLEKNKARVHMMITETEK